ncbi:hypothetical protein CCP3SC15_380037 [Gammaproteobacteria bacterium]
MNNDIGEITRQVNGLNALVDQLYARVTKLERPEFIDVVTLSTAQPWLTGKYRAAAEHIVVTLDATLGAFTVTLPSARDSKNIILIFKECKGLTAAVTLQAKPGEYIDNANTKVLTTAYGTLNLVSDRAGVWLIAG